MHSHVSAAAYVPSFALASRQSKQSSETTKTTVNKEVAQQETGRAEAGEVRYAMSTTAADYVPTRYALHATMQRRVERTTQPTNVTQTRATYTAPPRPMLLTSDEYSFLFATLSWNADLLLILLRNAASPLATPVIPAPVTPTVDTVPTRLTWSQLLTSSPASRLAQQQQQKQRSIAPFVNTCHREDEREEANRRVGALDARAFPTLLEAQRRWQSEKRRRPQPRVTDTALVGPDEDVLECEEGEDDVVDEEDHHVNNKEEAVVIMRRQPMSHAARRRRRRRGGGMATRHIRAHTLTCRPGPTSTEGNEEILLENIDESKPRWLMEQLGLVRGTRPQSLYTIPDEAAEQLYQELMTLTHLTSSCSPEASDDTVLCEKEDRANALRDALVRMGPDAMSDLYFQPWLLAQVVRSLRGEDVDDDDAREKKGGDRTDALDDENNSNDDEAYDDGESEALFYLSRRSRRRYKLVPGTTGDPRRKAQHVYYGPRIAHIPTPSHTTAVAKTLASAATTTAQTASTVKETTVIDSTVPASSSSTKEQIAAQPIINNIKAPTAPATQGIEFFVQMFLRAVLIVVIVQVRLNQASSTMSSTAPTSHAPSPAIVSSTTTLSAVERRALSFVRRYLPPFRALVTRYVMRCEVEVMRRAAQPLFMPPSPPQSTNMNAQAKVSEELLSSSGSDADGGSGEVPQRERLRHSAASPAREESPSSSTTATLFASDWLHDVLSEPYVSQGMHYVNSTLQRHSTASVEWAVRPLWTEQLYLSGKDAAWQPLLLELLDITRVVQCYADSSPAPHAGMESQEATGNVSGVTQAAPLPHRELLFRALTALLTRRLTQTSSSANNPEGAASISVEEEESEDYLAYLQPYLTPHSAMSTNEKASLHTSSSGTSVVPSTSLLAPLRWQLYATLPSHYDTRTTNKGVTSCKHDATSYESGSESGVYSQLYVTTLPLSGRLLVRWVLPAEDDSRYNLARFFEPRLFAFLQGGPLPAPTQSAVMPLLLFHAQQHAQGGSVGRRESALVHCSAGMHRSCGIVVAFLLWLVVQCRIVMQAAQPRLLPTQCSASLGSLQDVLTMCLRHVQAQRSMAEPIPAVVQQLQGFAESLGNI